ncbi:hypothetical protein HMH01_08730 [Halovulum dunhuangense]|uniref:Metalloprotease n=1 Tax=Halovulum dunhuangense TaxID=1505036 RepID=A0A849L2R0_9RHOB|nr:hypothetical protein [Halovulum dunhuangense]NNU80524.1 hypothetical protein [Halovulum dunhuangense]
MIRQLVPALLLALAAPLQAQPVQMEALSPETARLIRPVAEVAARDLQSMPAIRLTTRMADVCGGGDGNPLMRYCTSENVIFVASQLGTAVPDARAASYMLAHQLGHAVQVRHGQADLALAAIRAAPAREAVLRGMVTRQVECIAGVLHGRAFGAEGPSIADWFGAEPFTDAHWGRAPVGGGPRVSIGLGPRDEWFRRGRMAGTLSGCAVDELGTERIERAAR